jgi:hypothetical protein
MQIVCDSPLRWGGRNVFTDQGVVMAKSKIRNAVPDAGSVQPSRALLIELKGAMASEDEDQSAVSCTELFAALSVEEVLAYVRGRQPSVEIMELKVLGKVEVLSSSENLE